MAPPPRLVVIINPVSGGGGIGDRGRARVAQATAFLARHRLDGDVRVTERSGHARDLARSALTGGTVPVVVAWGGDGTVNEVASALAGSAGRMAIVPGGSGNGLARELGIPSRPEDALALASNGTDRQIDVGELDGHPFVNIAGLGLDARVAHRFAAGGPGRRGLGRYVRVTVRELLRREAEDYRVVTPTATLATRALLIAIANGRQYGNGAVIAPHARLDDGRLDMVVVAGRSPLRALAEIPFLFSGLADRLPGVQAWTTDRVEISAAGPLRYHVDGEPFTGGRSVIARIRPRALTVRC